MVTEILAAMIAVGAVLVLIARRLLMKGKVPPQTQDMQNLEVSANRLRYEMERSADQIVARIGEATEHLESLLQEATAQEARLQELTRRAEQLAQVEPTVPFAETLENHLRLEEAREQHQEARARARVYVPTHEAKAPLGTQGQEEAVKEKVDERRKQASKLASAQALQQASQISAPENAATLAATREQLPPLEAREELDDLISKGLANEEIARRTGLGKGAVELMRRIRHES